MYYNKNNNKNNNKYGYGYNDCDEGFSWSGLFHKIWEGAKNVMYWIMCFFFGVTLGSILLVLLLVLCGMLLPFMLIFAFLSSIFEVRIM